MTFVNITGTAFYLQCCHRAVEPGGSFQVPWEFAKRDRGLNAAMNCGRLAWHCDDGEAEVPGSPEIPDFKAIARRKAELAAERARADAERVEAAKERQARELSANMANMGNFDVPTPIKREVRARVVETEIPVTSADVIADGEKPVSLEALRRHNKATHARRGK